MVLADTGYWLALANARDHWHERAVTVGRRLTESLVSTWPVVTETCHLMLSRLGVLAEMRFIEQIARNVELHELGRAHLGAIQALMEKYADLPMDLSDASLVIAATELGDGRILTTDQCDFNAYQWKDTKLFRSLLEP